MDPFRIVRRDESAAQQEEAETKWGGSQLFKEAQRRTRRYTPADWAVIRLEAATILDELTAAMNEGVPAEDPRAVALAERHRRHFDKWYYPCDRQTHLGLSSLYTSDPRFAAGFEGKAPGLAGYLAAAIAANAKHA
jgi:MerR family transcriptional regulator, thiopeptide resistance regulator